MPSDTAEDSRLTAPPVNRNLLPKHENPILNLLGSGIFWSVIAVLVAVVPAIFYFGKLDNRVDFIHEGVTKLNSKLDEVNNGISKQGTEVGTRLGTLEHRVGSVEAGVDTLRNALAREEARRERRVTRD